MKRQKNLLHFIPVLTPETEREHTTENTVTISRHRRAWYQHILVFLFNAPAVIHRELDVVGSAVVARIDGKRDILTIAREIEREFGEDIHPLHERITTFILSLRAHRMIRLCPPAQRERKCTSRSYER